MKLSCDAIDATDPLERLTPCRQFKAVVKHYEGKTVLPGLDFAVAEGEFLTLLGPSGCGKTTVLRLLAGFEAPDAGEVYIDGVCVNGLPPHRRNVNTVFQSYALFPHLTVLDNVAFGLRMKKVPAARRSAGPWRRCGRCGSPSWPGADRSSYPAASNNG